MVLKVGGTHHHGKYGGKSGPNNLVLLQFFPNEIGIKDYYQYFVNATSILYQISHKGSFSTNISKYTALHNLQAVYLNKKVNNHNQYHCVSY